MATRCGDESGAHLEFNRVGKGASAPVIVIRGELCAFARLPLRKLIASGAYQYRGAVRFGATTSMLAGSDRDDSAPPIDLVAALDLSPERIAQLAAKGVIEGVIG